jgi:hypothetical protein
LIARAEKFQIQVNAKFDKGNFTAARTLYTLGIQIMAKLENRLVPKEAEMLSNMHSNHAVTFFENRISFRACKIANWPFNAIPIMRNRGFENGEH